MKCLIIIPAYNEAENIVKVIEKLNEHAPEYDYIIINDGSTDATAQICKDNHYNVLTMPINMGLAVAFQTGMQYALNQKYDCAIQYDGDGQHDAKYIRKMVTTMVEEKADVVIGSRFIDCKKPATMRMLGSNIIQLCIKLTTNVSIKDPTSGMRLFNRKMIEKLANTINYGPEPDTIAYLLRCGATVKEIQVVMHDRECGTSYFNFTRIIKYMVNMCLSITLIQFLRKREL